MSNAKYRNIGAPSAPQTAPEAAATIPTMPDLLERAKRVLGLVLEKAEASLRAGDGKISIRDGLNAARQMIAIARLEEAAARRADRAIERDRKAAPARAVEPSGAPGPAPSPAPELRPLPELAGATASPAPIQLPPPPG